MIAASEPGLIEGDPTSQATTASLNSYIGTEVQILLSLDLSKWPAIYLLPHGLEPEDYRDVVTKLTSMHANIAQLTGQARIILSYASGPARVKHDLISERFVDVDRLEPCLKNNATTPSSPSLSFRVKPSVTESNESHELAMSNQIDSTTVSNGGAAFSVSKPGPSPQDSGESVDSHTWNSDELLVLRLQWFYDSVAANKLLPLNQYVLLKGPWTARDSNILQKTSTQQQNSSKRRKSNLSGEYVSLGHGGEKHARTKSSQTLSKKRVLLSQETTQELEAIDQRPLPEWVQKQIKYSCQRKQTQPSANEGFLTELRLIKRKRLLDEVHNEKVRNSYGKAIASIAAYPHPFLHPSEVERLPRCGEKFGRLFRQFRETGSLEEADEMRNDPKLQTLALFWNIHGVGAYAAKNLYEKGYRTIDGLRYKVWPQLGELFEDDPVEGNRLDHLENPGLDREQQQGLKYYYDFLEPISREEVEQIAAIIEQHLKAITDDRAQVMLVGSYRKGKPTSGDVDIIVSHPEAFQTANLIDRLYDSLSDEGWIRAKLKISLAHTHRDQKPILHSHKSTASFAALDIALLVWQDKTWPSKEKDLLEDPDARNPATCRRVDIIVSPWKSVGCAVLGWSGGITFERDLREYAKKVLDLKFNSSGVLDRQTGKWIDIERYDDPATRAETIVEAERRVIEGLGLECYDPKERLTD
ncbi:MAG: hypothetical protein GOMPHAMPRED_002970 [Gomphillus americanus]|uniref:BRCT domain-containing protein n=1 Tax=Gomphillus americanus TaxID=1940652 RepID=A0A8H3I4Y1_9LECA|nr:MAG: hypothetical protein GOMPHAMPRED_002970 [Gomphillus americanus]